MSKQAPKTVKSNAKNEAKRSPKAPQAPTRQRVDILGYSATSVLKWMGGHDYSTEDATKVVSKLASAPLTPSTIATALSDGKNPKYNSNAASLSKAEAAKLKKVLKAA